MSQISIPPASFLVDAQAAVAINNQQNIVIQKLLFLEVSLQETVQLPLIKNGHKDVLIFLAFAQRDDLPIPNPANKALICSGSDWLFSNQRK